MQSINLELLHQISKKEGHPLEQKTDDIFRNHNFTSEQNYSLSNGDNLDVLAYSNANNLRNNSIFIIECKGTSIDKPLLLFAKSKKYIDQKPVVIPPHMAITRRSLDILTYEKTQGFKYYSPDLITELAPIISNANTTGFISFRFCYTGDFRNDPNNNYSKLPKNDISNNLYKGQDQLLKAMPLLLDKMSEILANAGQVISPKRIFPMIVTNAKIYIQEAEANKPVNNEKPFEVDWAVLECNKYIAPPIDHIFVVNINKLEEFINIFG